MSSSQGKKRRVFGRQSSDSAEVPPPDIQDEQTIMNASPLEDDGEVTHIESAGFGFPPQSPGGDLDDIPTMLHAREDVPDAPAPPPPRPEDIPTRVPSGSSDAFSAPRPRTPVTRVSNERIPVDSPSRVSSSTPEGLRISQGGGPSPQGSIRLTPQGKPIPNLKGYKLLDRLGAGTFGSVWRGIHLRTNAEMAVKLFDRSVGADWDYLKREIEALLTVGKHPNIVTLHDADFYQDPPFYTMEMMTTSMDALIREHRRNAISAKEKEEYDDFQWTPWPNLDQALKWMEEMARGLMYVHGKAFLHCDMKPANVLVDDQGSVRIVDFGQALLRGRDDVSLGTLFFMPPEQTEIEEAGKFQPDVRWDIYGLGATIYTLLAGRPPRSGKAQMKSISTAGSVKEKLNVYRVTLASTPLVSLTRIHPKISAEMAAIIEKCLEINPERRYGSMSELLEDISRMKQSQPMFCFEPWSRGYLLKRFVRRNGLWLAPFAALIAVLLVSQYYIIRQWQSQNVMVLTQFNADGSSFTSEAVGAVGSREVFSEAQDKLLLETFNRAKAALGRGDKAEAIKALESSAPLARSWDWSYLKYQAALGPDGSAPPPELGVERLKGLPRPVAHTVPSPNGGFVVINYPYGRGDAVSTRSGEPDSTYSINGEAFRSLAIGEDGKTVAGLAKSGEVYVRRSPSFREFERLGLHTNAKAVALTPDGRRVVTIDGGGTIKFWLIGTGLESLTITGAPPDVYAIEFSAKGNKMLLHDMQGGITVYQGLAGPQGGPSG